jgi:RNA polymerase sigma-70 factor (ECF subfamily)
VALAAHLGGPEGARAGLAALDAMQSDARMAEYQPWWAARADLLSRAGERSAAQAAYRRAIGLEPDGAVRRFLQRRLAACAAQA